MSAPLASCDYKTGKTLGHGTYATVKEAIKIATGEKFACKQISKKLMIGREDLILNEIKILKKISKGHPNIVTLHDYFETPNNLYLVTDLCTGGELFDRICEKGSFYENEASELIYAVTNAVAYLHEQGPENLIFDSRAADAKIKIADFGLSKLVKDDSMTRTTCGTPGYMAPEILQKSGHNKPVDMWAIGVITYFLLCGYMPFDAGDNRAKENDNVLRGKYKFDEEYWTDISDLAKDFISKLLVVDPSKRMTAKAALEHPWIDPAVETPAKVNLIANVRKGFNARQMFKRAIEVVKVVNTLSRGSLTKISNASLASIAQDSESSNMSLND